MIDNTTLLDVATEVFNRYDLPDEATIDGCYDRVRVSYVYVGGEGLKEMQRIQSAVEGMGIREVSGSVVMEHNEIISGVDVEIYAQMRAVDDRKPSKSAVDALREEILNG